MYSKHKGGSCIINWIVSEVYQGPPRLKFSLEISSIVPDSLSNFYGEGSFTSFLMIKTAVDWSHNCAYIQLKARDALF